ncbi:DUF2798 domain-containing protein [Allorhizobium taibaishanense]|uniref:Na+/glutamate symporter n=1 Tax=Allorhizobium taibaishanense TaxID=887144 RepID=A0A7W6HL32_9HYPH|nr:DUF2798 domain-containing protein [Allorhizobium taibaishanense]MBB4007225.1 Na+/glutamate symporter [Allorhizobium taibaishanense]
MINNGMMIEAAIAGCAVADMAIAKMDITDADQTVETAQQRRVRRYKLHHRTAPVVSAFFMAGIMALIMCTAIAAVNGGVTADLPARTLRAYAFAMPTAFLCVLLVRPLVVRLTAWIVHHPAA